MAGGDGEDTMIGRPGSDNFDSSGDGEMPVPSPAGAAMTRGRRWFAGYFDEHRAFVK